ncbi:MAG TPA: alpha/beta hydrolase [Candidatus Binatus sp.]|nr:alpha/beta hydrolase [Candidatus Binatus sp.]
MATNLQQSTHRARTALGASGHRVTIDGVSLAFDEEGAGPDVVCLHAIGHGAADFVRLRRRLCDRYRVLALDWPGQGNSGDDHVPASAVRYASLLEGFLAATGVTRPVLIGNSIGGAVALRHAAQHPDRVTGLVLENPGGLAATDDVLSRTALAAMARFFAAGARGAGWFPWAFAAYYRLFVLQRAAAAQQRRAIVASAFEIAPVLEQAWRSFATPESDVRTLVSRITCPVLFAWGARDQFVQLGRSLPAIRQFANARLEKFPVGHAAHLETPAALEALVEGFLAETVPEARRRGSHTLQDHG